MALKVAVVSQNGSPANAIRLSGMGPFDGSRTVSQREAPAQRIELTVAAGTVLVINDSSTITSTVDATILTMSPVPAIPAFIPDWSATAGKSQIDASYSANLRKLDTLKAQAVTALNNWRAAENAKAGIIRITGYLEQQSWQLQGTSYIATDPCRWSLKLTKFPPAGIDNAMSQASSAIASWYSSEALKLMVNYNFFINAQQTDVLDQLIALHPTVTWENTVITGESVLPALAEVAALFLPDPVYRDAPMGTLYEFAEKFKFVDPLPTTQMTLAQAKVFYDSKIPRAVDLVESVIVAGLSSVLIADVRVLIGAICSVQLVQALSRHMASAIVTTDRAAFNVYALSSPSYVQAMATIAGADTVSPTFYDGFTAALRASTGFSRGTYIVCPSSSYWQVRDVFDHVYPIHKAAGISAAPGTASVVGAREQLYAKGIEPFLMALARGALVVGWSSDALVATYAVTARAHGFNVVFLEHDATAVRKAAARNYADLLAKGSDAVKVALRGVSVEQYTEAEFARSANMVEYFERLRLPYTFTRLKLSEFRPLVKKGHVPLGTV